MATAQELVDYATSLTNSAAAVNAKANDPALSFADAKAAHDKAWAIAQQAWKVNNMAQNALTQDVAQAITTLTAANDAANTLIARLTNINAIISVGAAILSVAAAVTTGNPLTAAGAVNNLATLLMKLTAANS